MAIYRLPYGTGTLEVDLSLAHARGHAVQAVVPAAA